MILASGPGPNSIYVPPPPPITPDDLLTWVWIGMLCALLLLAEAILSFAINRKQSAAAWRHPFFVLVLIVASVFAAGVAVYAWTLYRSARTAFALYASGWTLRDPTAAATQMLDGFLPFGVAVLIGTLALLAAGAVAVLLPEERLALVRPIDTHRSRSLE